MKLILKIGRKQNKYNNTILLINLLCVFAFAKNTPSSIEWHRQNPNTGGNQNENDCANAKVSF
jgi:hypothetical protein